MKRPKTELHEAIKSQELYGKWENANTILHIDCTGSFTYIEKRYGEVFNKDTGGDIVKLNVDKKELISKTIFGENQYYYNPLKEGEIQFLVGKRAPLIAELKDASTWYTMVDADLVQTLKQTQKPNCDNAPYTLSEVFDDIGKKLQNGEPQKSEE